MTKHVARSTILAAAAAAAAAGVVLLGWLTGCTPGTPAPPRTVPSAAPVSCPSSHGGACLGPLKAGTYTTQLFTPGISYTVPEGWANYEDLPGNFLLVPPTGSLDGVDAGTSDYIGIYTSIAALALDCATVPANTGRTPADIAGWLVAEPALAVTDGGAVDVGGLDGLVLDLTLNDGAGVTCEGLDFPLVPLFTGQPPSSLEHAMIPGLTMRLHLLAYGDRTLAIEVNDLADGRNLAAYSHIVDSIRFTETTN